MAFDYDETWLYVRWDIYNDSPNTEVPAHSYMDSNEIHYIISGSGKIIIGEQSERVKEGMLILVPKAEFHYFSTLKDPLIVLSNSPVCEPPESTSRTY